MEALEELAQAVRAHPGLLGKAPIAIVTEVLGATDWLAGPGDDGAVIADGDGALVVGGEALWPPFVKADPYGAGIAAVLTNVNDLAAMGAEPLAIVDTIVADEAVARAALEGMRHAAELYRVPIVGGHLTLQPNGPPALSAFGLGRAAGAVLASRRAAPGQLLVLACALDGDLRADFQFFASFEQRGERLAGDVRVLAHLARSGAAVAAKDVSMAGIVGSLAMLLEPSGLGVALDVDLLPRPPDLDLSTWLRCFPGYAFLLCVPPEREADALAPFHDRGIAAATVGTLDATGCLRLRRGTHEAAVLDLAVDTVTGLA